MPPAVVDPPVKTELRNPENGGGGGEPPGQTPPVKSRDDLQNEYIAALIEALREKNKQGQLDQELMERIERLLDLKSA